MSTAKPFRLVVNNVTPQKGLCGVYLITDQQDRLLERVALALRGGVSVVQYRAKGKEFDEMVVEGAALLRLCRRHGALCIVNDNVRLARDLDADGVHLGQEDGSIAEARAVLGAGKLIGRSTHDREEALQAEREGADYIGFGAIYPTNSKVVSHMPGYAGLEALCGAVRIPVVAIGGLTATNAGRIVDAGANGIAVISSVLSASRPDIAAAELSLLFNRVRPLPRGAVLTVAGSDSGGGAGIQADIKTISLLGSYAASVITALTAQNTQGVVSIHGLPPSFIADQLKAVLNDIPIDVIKTGMLHTPAIISELAEFLTGRDYYLPTVIDPVMIAKGGTSLLEHDAVQLFLEQLLPHAYLLTPNLPEAERLVGRTIKDVREMEQAARELHERGAATVLVKGGHLPGRLATDVFFDGNDCHHLSCERIFTLNTHGTGCSYASAIATFLSQGEPLLKSIELAKQFIGSAIRQARSLGKGHSPVNHLMAAQELMKMRHLT